MIRYRARFVFPEDGEPISNGVVEVREGRIHAVERSRSRDSTVDLGDVALVPGLVNAHTHLEFSDLPAPVAPGVAFPDWIRAVLAARSMRTAEPADAIRKGLAESFDAGTVLLGEIATGGWDGIETEHAGPRAVVFHESIGATAEQLDARIETANAHLENFQSRNSSATRGGLSPHAPYTVHPELLKRLVSLAVERNVPVAMHVAETVEELELLDCGTGPLADLLRERGIPWERESSRPLDVLRELARAPQALVVHGNYLSEAEIEYVASHPRLTVVYCPRTHAYFSHAEHPWRELLQRGGRVALGTDSRASNPDLSLWNELLFLREKFPSIAPRALLDLGTRNGAEALGGFSCGRIAPGYRADLTAIELPETSGDPWELLLHPHTQVAATILEGRLARRKKPK